METIIAIVLLVLVILGALFVLDNFVKDKCRFCIKTNWTGNFTGGLGGSCSEYTQEYKEECIEGRIGII